MAPAFQNDHNKAEGPASASYERQYNRRVKKTQRNMAFERLWPRALPGLIGGGTFLTLSWIGLWAVMPPVATAITVGALLTGTAVSPFLVKEKSPFVSRKEAIDRLDQNLDINEKPARKLGDSIAPHSSPQAAAVLKHKQETLWKKWSQKLIKAGRPVFKKTKARIAGLAILGALTASSVFTGHEAGNERQDRLKEAFNWKTPETPVAPLTVRAWVRPPDNIDARVIQLSDTTKSAANDHQGDLLVIHPKSTMTIITYGTPESVTVNGNNIRPENDDATNEVFEYKLEFEGKDTEIKINHAGRSLTWHIQSITDMKPAVQINGVNTKEDAPHRVNISTGAKDDFGIASGSVTITLPKDKLDQKATPLPSGQPKTITLPGIRYRD